MLGVPLAIGLVAASTEKKKSPAPGPPPPRPPGGPPPPVPPTDVPVTEPPAPGEPPQTPGPVPGGLIAALPENYGPGREQMILDAVRAGLAEDPVQNVITVDSPGEGAYAGHTLKVPVMGDALKIDGVRVNTNFETAQRIADALGGFMMLTPYVAGLISEQAHAKLEPTTAAKDLTVKHATARKSQMIEASRRVDDKLAPIKATRDAQGLPTLVSNPGKDWVLTIQYTHAGAHPESGVPKAEAGANHGLYTSPWHPIQNVGLYHPMDHVDYSQTVRFMGTHSALVDPNGATTLVANADVLSDPDMAHMLTGVANKRYGKQWGEGRLSFARHPALAGGIPV